MGPAITTIILVFLLGLPAADPERMETALETGGFLLGLEGTADAWRAFLSENLTPEGVDFELWNPRNPASNAIKLLHILLIKIDLLYETKDWKYAMLKDPRDMPLFTYDNELVLYLAAILRGLWEVGNSPDKPHLVHNLLDQAWRVSKYSPDLSHTLTDHILHLLAPKIPIKVVEAGLHTRPMQGERKWISDALRRYKERAQEFSQQVFCERAANMSPKQLGVLISTRIPPPADPAPPRHKPDQIPINTLMNLAYRKNQELETKGQATMILALFIQRASKVDQGKWIKMPPPSLVQYYAERRSKYPAAPVPELPNLKEDTLKLADECVLDLHARTKKLWEVEADQRQADLLARLSPPPTEGGRLPPDEEEKIDALIAAIERSTEDEEKVFPLEYRLPKYWISQYVVCRWRGQLGCMLFLCLAAANRSSHLVTAELKCHEYIQNLDGLPSHITASGAKRTLMYRMGRIELTKIRHTAGLVERILELQEGKDLAGTPNL